MAGKNPGDLSESSSEGHLVVPAQHLAGLGGLGHGGRLILRRHEGQNRNFTPPRTPIAELDPNRHVLDSLQPRRRDRERRDQRHAQWPALRPLYAHHACLRQVLEPEARRRRRRRQGHSRRDSRDESSWSFGAEILKSLILGCCFWREAECGHLVKWVLESSDKLRKRR
ncbi:hypothetical protein TIFTF001_015586 [Ficus carica]|uniref:Uncharacterized protein n=1 Tax=Ficus carica TaxID=3494 RepID=A0AA88ASH8_FICCA|nr:hypothetical protein TIFTF001_015586 [Ficus carica]